MNQTGIEWCDFTWNPIVGCSPRSEGCANCYAEAIARRFNQPWGHARFLVERLRQPNQLSVFSKMSQSRRETVIRRRTHKGWPDDAINRSHIVFVCSMSDFYHEDVDDVTRSSIMGVISQNPEHTFVILTKRPHRIPDCAPWLRNVWLGVSAENQERFDERWSEMLMRTRNPERPVVRFVSVEPMLGPVTVSGSASVTHPCDLPDWVIAGPETGSKARPCDTRWIDDLDGEPSPFFDKRDLWLQHRTYFYGSRNFPMV